MPPLPLCLPPRAVSLPAISVSCVLSTVTRPPLPLALASAEIRAPAAMAVRPDVPAGAAPVPRARMRVVPSAIVPPPAMPEALICAPPATDVVWLAMTTTSPPVLPGALPSAARRPSTTTEPPVPVISIRPVRSPTLLAWICPPARTRFCTTPSAAFAVSCTTPPSAMIVPVLVTSAVTGLPSGPRGACFTWPVTSIDTRPSPYISSVCICAPASTTWPNFALITPELTTLGATSAASPACLTVMVPRFSTRASGCAALSNTMRPAMKFRFVMPGALTITLCAFTCAPW